MKGAPYITWLDLPLFDHRAHHFFSHFKGWEVRLTYRTQGDSLTILCGLRRAKGFWPTSPGRWWRASRSALRHVQNMLLRVLKNNLHKPVHTDMFPQRITCLGSTYRIEILYEGWYGTLDSPWIPHGWEDE